MATSTTRMALTKPSGSASPAEAVDVGVLNTNADLLDKFAPCILVNDGVTPATGDLYDGALVKEKTSGKIWEARKNGGGTFDKVWVRYPWSMISKTNAANVASSTSFADYGTDTWVSGKNSSSSDISVTFNDIKIPLKGIYTLKWRYRFAANATGTRSARLSLNGSTIQDETEVSCPGNANSFTGLEITLHRAFALGDLIHGQYWQNSGGNLSMYTQAETVMVEPIQ